MFKMKQLPPSTSRLLSCSQVITSVTSVIKELVENSLDATASAIDVKLDNYGLDCIEVRDNGHGISRKDVSVMAKRHYTSKITDTADLPFVGTYGFRGEALGSLCGLADVCIVTKTADDTISMQYQLDVGGGVLTAVPSHLGVGTSVIARNLFKKLPVRKQYYNTLKKKKDELRRVERVLMAFGLIHPGVRFSLRHDKCVVWQKASSTDVRTVLLSVLGHSVANSMVYNKRAFDTCQVVIEMFVPSPSSNPAVMSRSTNDRCFVYVNKRPVVSKRIEKLLKKYYNKAMATNSSHFPLACVIIQVPTCDTDVNIEPNKTMVLLHNEDEVISCLDLILQEVYGESYNGHLDTLTYPNKGADDLSQVDSVIGAVFEKEQYLGKTTCPGSRKQQNVVDLDWSLEDCDATNSSLGTELPVSGSFKLHLAETQDIRSHCMSQDNDNEKPCDHTSANVKEHRRLFPVEKICTPVQSEDSEYRQDAVVDNVKKGHDLLQLETHCHEESDFGNHDVLGDTCASNSFLLSSTSMFDDSFDAVKSDASILLNNHSKDVVVENKSSGVCANGDDSEDMEDNSTWQSPSDVLEKSSTNICTAKSWIKGIMVDKKGRKLEPVMLLPPKPCHSSGISSPVSQHTQGKLKALTETPNQPKLTDFIKNKPVKHPTPAFVYFAKDVRPRVTAENPHASYQEIEKIIGRKWKQLMAEEREKYELMNKEDVRRYENDLCQARGSCDEAIVKRRKTNSGPIQPVLGLIIERDMAFNISGLQLKFSGAVQISQEPPDDLRLIGPLKSCDVWICCYGSELLSFHPVRAQEVVCYNRLCDTDVLLCKQLEDPVLLEPSPLGEYWDCLMSMERETRPPDTTVFFTDKRLHYNGVDIRIHPSNSGVSDGGTYLHGTPRCVPCFSLQDLKDLLHLVKQNAIKTICRPSAVHNYLISEAVRMTRLLPVTTSKQDAQDILQQLLDTKLNCSQPNLHHLQDIVCSHNKPVFTSLMDISSVCHSQRSDSQT